MRANRWIIIAWNQFVAKSWFLCSGLKIPHNPTTELPIRKPSEILDRQPEFWNSKSYKGSSHLSHFFSLKYTSPVSNILLCSITSTTNHNSSSGHWFMSCWVCLWFASFGHGQLWKSPQMSLEVVGRTLFSWCFCSLELNSGYVVVLENQVPHESDLWYGLVLLAIPELCIIVWLHFNLHYIHRIPIRRSLSKKFILHLCYSFE